MTQKLGIPYDSVRVNILETGALGFNEPTHGSRATLASGMLFMKLPIKQLLKCVGV